MKTGNSLSTVGPGLSADLDLTDAPAKSQFDGLNLKIKYPFTVTTAPVTGDVALLTKIINAAIGSLTLEHGPKGRRSNAYNAAKGEEIENAHRYAMRNMPPNNIVGTVFAVGAQVGEVTLQLPFFVRWLRGERKRPGTSQVRAMKLKIVEAALVAHTNVARTAGAQVVREVEFLNRPGPDIHAQILTLTREQSPKKNTTGPDGLTVGAWLVNSKAADTTLKAFKVMVGGVLVHDLQTPAGLAAAFDEEHQDVGGGTITDTVTPIYFATDNEEIDELVHGPVEFEMSEQDIASVQLHVLHYPALSEAEAKQETIDEANTKQTPVLMTLLERSAFAHPGAAAVANRRPVTPSDARFVSEPGLVATVGAQDAQPSVPAHIIGATEQGARAVASQGAHVADAFARRIQKLTAMKTPGVTTTTGKGLGSIRTTIRGAFRGAFKR